MNPESNTSVNTNVHNTSSNINSDSCNNTKQYDVFPIIHDTTRNMYIGLDSFAQRNFIADKAVKKLHLRVYKSERPLHISALSKMGQDFHNSHF